MTDLTSLLIFLAVGTAGAFANWLLRWLRGEIAGSLFAYLFRESPRRTALAVLTFWGGAITAWLSGTLDGSSLKLLVLAAFGSGYAVDNSLNRGASLTGGPGPTKPKPTEPK